MEDWMSPRTILYKFAPHEHAVQRVWAILVFWPWIRWWCYSRVFRVVCIVPWSSLVCTDLQVTISESRGFVIQCRLGAAGMFATRRMCHSFGEVDEQFGEVRHSFLQAFRRFRK